MYCPSPCARRDLNPHDPLGPQRPQRCVSAISPQAHVLRTLGRTRTDTTLGLSQMPPAVGLRVRLGSWTRTSGLFLPEEADYQTFPYPDVTSGWQVPTLLPLGSRPSTLPLSYTLITCYLSLVHVQLARGLLQSGQISIICLMSGWLGSNQRSPASKAGTMPLDYSLAHRAGLEPATRDS